MIDFATHADRRELADPRRRQPRHGRRERSTATTLWLAGRYDNEVYAIDTTNGTVTKIPVGNEPHGLAVWPQPGRYSLGHTSNLR